jgi:hypothetical protein
VTSREGRFLVRLAFAADNERELVITTEGAAMRRWRISLILVCLAMWSVSARAQEPLRLVSPPQPQSRALNLLHVSFASLEAVDVYTTVRGVNAGAVEANPLICATAASPVGLTAVKAGVALSSIVLTRRLARQHRVAAIVLAATLNSAYAAVAVHNLRVGRR